VELLIRVEQKKRRVLHEGKSQRLEAVLAHLPAPGSGWVKVWRRHHQPERQAQVWYYATSVEVPPTYKQTLPSQPMHLVAVREKASRGQPPEWVFLTSLPAHTLPEVVQPARYYAQRWVVERFHYTLKSGFAVEKLQFESARGLQKALPLYSLAAWHVLWLDGPGQAAAEEDAKTYFADESVELLSAVSQQNLPTVRSFLVALARLGGFRPTRRQPLPGEQSLWKGLRQFQAVRLGFLTALQKYGTG